jgi:hypothetical protein
VDETTEGSDKDYYGKILYGFELSRLQRSVLDIISRFLGCSTLATLCDASTATVGGFKSSSRDNTGDRVTSRYSSLW